MSNYSDCTAACESDEFPIIVGDCYKLAETTPTLYSGGFYTDLLAKPAYSAAPLPMSGYEKSSIADLNGFDITRQSQNFDGLANYDTSGSQHEPVYQYALPGHHASQLESNVTPYDNHADQTAIFIGTSSFPQRHDHHLTTRSLYRDVESRRDPELCTRYEPRTGTGGTLVCVYLDSNSDLQTPSPLNVSLIFEKRHTPATLRPREHQAHDDGFKYIVSGVAPLFSDMETSNPFVSLRLQYQDATGQNTGLIDIGIWQYEDEREPKLQPSPIVPRKRKSTSGSHEELMLAKRASPTVPQSNTLQLGSYSSASAPIMEYPQAMHPIDWDSMQRKLTPYGRSLDQQSLQGTSNTSSRSIDGGLPVSQTLMKPPMTQASNLSPPYMTSYRSGRSPRLKPTPSFNMPSSSPDAPIPRLVRASTIQQHSNSGPNPAVSSTDGTFYQNNMYTHASIKICSGDLNSMQDNWTTEERAAKRRLVRFRGKQDDSTIETYFKTVKPDERPTSQHPRERRVSCIYWEERDEYFVTSVDTIALLETLVGSRFQVQEKNRIRRNLEQYQPLTIAKGKPETESFFKVIMGLPNPKPRNIEKDVKVFPWPILGQALSKVISKYSPSPASTAGPLATSHSLNYSAERSNANSDRYRHLSSRSSTGSSSTYASTLSSSTLSPPTPSQNLSSQYSQAAALPMSLPSHSHSSNAPTWADKYLQDQGGSSFDTSYSDLPSGYPAYASSSSNRRRSEEGKPEAGGVMQYPTRPRASTSFSAMYQATQDPSSDYSLSQLPSSFQASRPSWDISAFFRGELGSFGHDDAHGTQYRLPARQNSHSLQYPHATMEAPSSQ